MRIVARGLFDSVKEPNRSGSWTCGCCGVGGGPGGREDERVVDAIIVDSTRRIEGGLTTLRVANEMIRTWVDQPMSEDLGGVIQNLRIIQVPKQQKNRDVNPTIPG